MLIHVHVSNCIEDRVVSVEACTLRVEAERLRSDPSSITYKLVGYNDQGRLLIRCSENAAEIFDLYDFYMDRADEKRKASGEQLSLAEMSGGDPDAGF